MSRQDGMVCAVIDWVIGVHDMPGWTRFIVIRSVSRRRAHARLARTLSNLVWAYTSPLMNCSADSTSVNGSGFHSLNPADTTLIQREGAPARSKGRSSAVSTYGPT